MMGGYRGPRAQLAAARAWREGCPEARERLVSLAYAQQRDTGRVSIACAFEAMRAEERQAGRPGRYGLDNSMKPAIARLLAEEEPLLAASIAMRESGVDSVLFFERLEGGADGKGLHVCG